MTTRARVALLGRCCCRGDSLLCLLLLFRCQCCLDFCDLMLPPSSHSGLDGIHPPLNVDHAAFGLPHHLHGQRQIVQLISKST